MKPVPQTVKKVICVASDPYWTLEAWQKFINELVKNHGKDAVLFSDASYNNVELVLSLNED